MKINTGGPRQPLTITYLLLSDLRASARNARTHTAKQVEQIAASIKEFGFVNPILVDRHNKVIAGHGRVEAAKLLGLKSVPAIRAEHLSEEQKRAYMLADNRLAELAEWNKDILERELAELKTLDLNFDLEVTGFDLGEIDVWIEAGEDDRDQHHKDTAVPGHADTQPAKEKRSAKKSKAGAIRVRVDEDLEPVTRPDDLWILRDHRLICGRPVPRSGNFDRLLQGERVQMAITMLPITVEIVPGPELNATKRYYLDGILGWMMRRELVRELNTGLSLQSAYCDAGATQVLLIPTLVIDEVLEACGYLYAVNEIRDYGGHLLLVTGPALETIANHTPAKNILVKAPVTECRAATPELLAEEPILETSKPGDLVLDVYGSDGDTLMAAEETGRCARVIELSGAKVDAIIRRWQELTGLEARLEQSGQTFSEVRQERMAQGIEENPYSDPVLEELIAEKEGGAR